MGRSEIRIPGAGGESNNSPPFSAEVENKWRYTSALLVCLHDVDRENDAFTFIFILVNWHKYVRQSTVGDAKGLR